MPVQTSDIDKLLHFTIYSVFAYLLTRQISQDTSPGRAGTGAVLIAAAFAAADEWHQAFIPGRFPEFADWLADVAGAIIGAAFYGFLLSRRRKAARVP